MSIALKIGDKDSQVQGFIFLDATTSYSRKLKGKVSSFPVDSGANISDHFISENQKITVSGVISDVDVTGVSDKIALDGEKPVNSKVSPSNTQIVGQERALKYLPTAVKQFFERSNPSVATDPSSQTTSPAVQALFEELMKGVYYNPADNRWRSKMTPVTLYEVNGTVLGRKIDNLVLIGVDFDTEPDDGDSLRLSLELEQVRFASIEFEDASKVKSTFQKKATKTEQKGTPPTTTGTGDTTKPSTDPIAPGRIDENYYEQWRRRNGVDYSLQR